MHAVKPTAMQTVTAEASAAAVTADVVAVDAMSVVIVLKVGQRVG